MIWYWVSLGVYKVWSVLYAKVGLGLGLTADMLLVPYIHECEWSIIDRQAKYTNVIGVEHSVHVPIYLYEVSPDVLSYWVVGTRFYRHGDSTDLPSSYHLCIPLDDLLNPSFYPSTSCEGHDGPTPLCQFP